MFIRNTNIPKSPEKRLIKVYSILLNIFKIKATYYVYSYSFIRTTAYSCNNYLYAVKENKCIIFFYVPCIHL